ITELLPLVPIKLGIGQNVGDSDGLALERNPTRDAIAPGNDNLYCDLGPELCREAERGGEYVGLALAAPDQPTVRATQSDRRLDQRIEHLLQVEGRAADGLEHVCGSSLLLQ